MPEKMSVQAQVPEKKDASGKVTQKQLGPVTVEVTTGVTAVECIALFGDEAVKTNADANWTVTLQSNIRAGLKKGETLEQLQIRLGGAKMGVAQRGVVVDPIQAYLARFDLATPAEKAKLIAELQGRMKK